MKILTLRETIVCCTPGCNRFVRFDQSEKSTTVAWPIMANQRLGPGEVQRALSSHWSNSAVLPSDWSMAKEQDKWKPRGWKPVQINRSISNFATKYFSWNEQNFHTYVFQWFIFQFWSCCLFSAAKFKLIFLELRSNWD